MNERELEELAYISREEDASELIRSLVREKYRRRFGVVRVVAAIVSGRRNKYAMPAEIARVLLHATGRQHPLSEAEVATMCNLESDLVRSRRGNGYRLRDGLTVDQVLARPF
jgi:hypothetical protein